MDWHTRKLNILVVDDDVVSRTVLNEHLTAAGHVVVLAASVPEAKAALEHKRVHVVIADWLMPGATGIELCRWLRRQTFGLSLHFVMLTVLSEKARLIEAFEAGVDDFLSKPFHEGELTARLLAWTRIVTLHEQLAQQATCDELTGLPNRREAIRCLSEQWTIASRYHQPLCCAVVDVDNFKQINDTAGHAAGDRVLRDLAQLLSASVREADVVFRIGGDEFLVLFPSTVGGGAREWADRCAATITGHRFKHAQQDVSTAVSIGTAQRAEAMENWSEMLEAADAAMLARKREGRSALRLLLQAV